jgi:phage shock protein A
MVLVRIAPLGRFWEAIPAVGTQLRARVDAFRTRKEVLKATYAATQGTLRVREAIAASSLAGDDASEQQEDTGETSPWR